MASALGSMQRRVHAHTSPLPSPKEIVQSCNFRQGNGDVLLNSKWKILIDYKSAVTSFYV